MNEAETRAELIDPKLQASRSSIKLEKYNAQNH
jgi:hypothetical protein